MKLSNIHQFDIWFAHLPMREDSHVQGGRRPVIIVSNNAANKHSPIVSIVPLFEMHSTAELYYSPIKPFNSLRHIFRHASLSSLTGVSPPASSASPDEKSAQSSVKAFYRRIVLEAGDRAQRETKYHPSTNCLSRYRIEKGLSYAQLGERMGLTRQRVQIACKQKQRRSPA